MSFSATGILTGFRMGYAIGSSIDSSLLLVLLLFGLGPELDMKRDMPLPPLL